MTWASWLPVLMTMNFDPLPLANLVPFMLTAVFATFIYTWVYNHTGGSILLAILLHASSNAASGWLSTLFKAAGLGEPTVGLAGFLVRTGHIDEGLKWVARAREAGHRFTDGSPMEIYIEQRLAALEAQAAAASE